MFQSILITLASMFTKETFSSLGNAILNHQVRSCFKRAIRDVVEDEVKRALIYHGVKGETSNRYIKAQRREFRKEIDARFNALLMK